MSIHSQTKRTIFPALLVVASLALAPAAAGASSLLSGYGGPGEGSQVVLGGHLIGGGGGGGGGTGGGAGAGTSSSATGAAAAGVPTQTRATGGNPSAAARSRAAGTSGTSPRGGVRGSASAGAKIAYPSYSTTGSQAIAVDSDPLGLSGVDLIFVLVATALVVFTGVLTRQLAQAPQDATIGAEHFDRTRPQ
jgi:hypothetical protein